MTHADLLILPLYSNPQGHGNYMEFAFKDGTRHDLRNNDNNNDDDDDDIDSESEKIWCECYELVGLKQWEEARNALRAYHGMGGSKFDFYLHTQIMAALFANNGARNTEEAPWSEENSLQFYHLVDCFIDRLRHELCGRDDHGFGSDEIIAELYDVVLLYVNRCMMGGNSESPLTVPRIMAAHRALIKFFSVAGVDTHQVENWVQDQEEAFDYIAQGLIELGELNEAEIVLKEACGVCKGRTSVFLAMRAEIAEASGNMKLAHELYQKLGDTTISSFYDDDEPNWMAGLGERCPLGTWAERVHRTASYV